ncbi:unnamed protein product [Protopolystoma xenopodis]|uniref:Uncharacterized protein n=1 Tax=Protopolystoma xenopodis TaxID=117903 RepID=A0A3S5AE00_9PLAT|nr:unnamed protein product [Protopolystoma xenopodis]
MWHPKPSLWCDQPGRIKATSSFHKLSRADVVCSPSAAWISSPLASVLSDQIPSLHGARESGKCACVSVGERQNRPHVV